MARVRRNRSSVAVAIQPATRCAIYTRKSTDEGLDRSFNSLDNQRERAEAYVESQRDQGWTILPDRYDDGGFSGGNTDRPALKRLMRDVESGDIEAIVVYRLDRISRSLADFVNIHEFLERHGVALVSVTESINTSTAHGRMMVNVLLSFAQYERELAAERTRHKIEAARRKGKWTGGRPVLGFDVVDRRLVPNADEAIEVKAIFEMYAESPSLIGIVQELNRRGWRQKSWTAKTGRPCGGGEWNKVSLRRLLNDPLYAGLQKLGDETFKGEHERIVPKKLFDRVQRLIRENRQNRGASARDGSGFLLRGLIRCSACDAAMTGDSHKSRNRRHRYYRCSAAIKRGRATCPTKSLPADKIESFVVDQIRRIGVDPKLQDETFRQAVVQVKAQRRGLRAEKTRFERELVTVRADVERLVGALSRATGPAADAIATELEKAQGRVQTVESRLREIRDELTVLRGQDVDRDDLTRALEAFDPIWDALLIPERERVMKLLVERIDYDGVELAITWRLGGFGELVDEVGS